MPAKDSAPAASRTSWQSQVAFVLGQCLGLRCAIGRGKNESPEKQAEFYREDPLAAICDI